MNLLILSFLLLLPNADGKASLENFRKQYPYRESIANCSSPCDDLESLPSFESAEKKFIESLVTKCNLKSNARPLKDYSEVIQVAVNFLPLRFRGVKDREQQFAFLGEIDFFWKHPCTKWSLANMSIPYFKLRASEVWYPGLSINNAISDVMPFDQLAKESLIYFFADGSVSWQIMSTFSVFCDLNFKKFPFDKQTCSMVLESWEEQPKTRLFLRGNGYDIFNSDFVSHAEVWELKNIYTENTSLTFIADNLTYDRAVLTFVIARKFSIYMNNIFLPCLVLQTLSVLSVWIPAKHPDRAVFCITVLLAYVLLQAEISKETPKSAIVSHFEIFVAFQLSIAFVITVYGLISNDLADKEYYKQNIKFNQPFPFTKWPVRISRIRMLDFILYGFFLTIKLLADFGLFAIIAS